MTMDALTSVKTLNSGHLDFVHDVAFDFYGRRIATCSGDRTVRIYDLDDNGEWSTTGEAWQAHRGAVTKISWAHPEFGQLLATCGSDHDAKVWEERDGGRWIAKASLTDARRAVSCVEFSPRHLGLKLATGSADGMVRIYEATDVMNLNQWPMMNGGTIEAEIKSELGVTCLSWCSGRFEPPTLVMGGTNLAVYRYSDSARQWQMIVQLPNHSGRGILDVSWAPNVGRSFHWIASAGKDKVLRIHKIKRKEGEVESSKVLKTNGAEVWRCQWNVTGSVLASSGDGGVVQLWKSDFRNNWKCVSQVHGDISQQAATPMMMT